MIIQEFKLVGFDYANASTIEEIKRNLEFFFSTFEGTCPGDRRLGIDPDIVDSTPPVAEQMLSQDLMEKVPVYEPRVEVDDVSCFYDGDGQLKSVVTIIPNSDYEDEQEDQ